jgi:RNA polymerase sigma-70 factor, ECF subfamily
VPIASAGCQATAEDVVQDTWLVVLNGVNRFDGRSSLKTWIHRILTNRAKTAGQRERRCVADSAFPRREIEAAEAGTPADRFRPERGIELSRHWTGPPASWVQSVDEALVTSEQVAFVVAAINLLPVVQRLVITLRDVEGWTATEVCNALELSEANQRVLLHRARSKVRMGTAFVEPPSAA